MSRIKPITFVASTIIHHILIVVITLAFASSQQTELDTQFRPYFRTLRNIITDYVQINVDKNAVLEYNRKLGKLQKQFHRTMPFPCDVSGPGKRSKHPPSSVHELRPGDIDIIGALGDSLTSGNGVTSTDVLGMLAENKGVIFSIGGDLTWREYLTLPNILKEFNANLYGYSLGYATSYHRNSRFNVAEPMAMSQDMKFQAELLYKRMNSDPNVNMTHHWKVVTIFTGHNDLCGNLCNQDELSIIEEHTKDLLKVLRFLRDNVPRLVVNYVPFANLKELFKFKGIPVLCDLIDRVECPCFFRSHMDPKRKQMYSRIMEKWLQVDLDVINRDEFHLKEDFAVVFQPFSINAKFPINGDGSTDLRYLATDCFHFSQRGQARMANALWNNMLQQEGRKVDNWAPELEYFECPTETQPFFATRRNKIFYV